jgi:hypothetical protein
VIDTAVIGRVETLDSEEVFIGLLGDVSKQSATHVRSEGEHCSDSLAASKRYSRVD